MLMVHVHDPTRLRFALVTISDTRTLEDDTSGDLMETQVSEHGHNVVHRTIIPDEPDQITTLILELSSSADVICLSGGTGISHRDQTCEAVMSVLDRVLPGFGELSRFLSYEEIGAAAMLSRAVGGVCANAVVFSLPGSPHAVRLALDKLILPQVSHLVAELQKHQP